MNRVGIVGCRPPDEREEGWVALYARIHDDVCRFVASLPRDAVVVSGGASGVDTIAVKAWAVQLGYPLHERKHPLARGWTDIYLDTRVAIHEPNYRLHGKAATLKRNELIARDCDELHAWPAPWSRGTWHTVRLARELGKPVTIHEVV